MMNGYDFTLQYFRKFPKLKSIGFANSIRNCPANIIKRQIYLNIMEDRRSNKQMVSLKQNIKDMKRIIATQETEKITITMFGDMKYHQFNPTPNIALDIHVNMEENST